MRSAIFAALLLVGACKDKPKEVTIVNNPPPTQVVVEPAAPLPAANPNVNAAPPAEPTAPAPVEVAPTGGTQTAPRILDAGVVPDAIDTNGLVPEH
jgi:hypothetical protein